MVVMIVEKKFTTPRNCCKNTSTWRCIKASRERYYGSQAKSNYGNQMLPAIEKSIAMNRSLKFVLISTNLVEHRSDRHCLLILVWSWWRSLEHGRCICSKDCDLHRS